MAQEDTNESEERVLLKVVDIATIAGYQVVKDAERRAVVCGFSLPGGRSQQVFIRYAGKTPRGDDCVTFFSPCRVFEKGLLKGLSKKAAIALLESNEHQSFARFALWDGGNQHILVASCDQLVDSMEPEEFESKACSVAFAADEYEMHHNVDEY